MNYIRSILQPHEEIKFVGGLHWIRYGRAAAIGLLALIVYGFGFSAGSFHGWFSLAALLIAIVALYFALIAWFVNWTTEIAVTNLRVIHKTGFIQRDTQEMNMDKIESVKVDQTFTGRVLDYGTISVLGTGHGIENLQYVARPITLRNAIVAR